MSVNLPIHCKVASFPSCERTGSPSALTLPHGCFLIPVSILGVSELSFNPLAQAKILFSTSASPCSSGDISRCVAAC